MPKDKLFIPLALEENQSPFMLKLWQKAWLKKYQDEVLNPLKSKETRNGDPRTKTSTEPT